MSEPTERTPSKRKLSLDLKKEGEDLPKKVRKTKGPPGDLDEEKKRWLVVGICLHSVISPLLRKHVDPEVYTLYKSLVTSHSIDTQMYPTYVGKYPTTFCLNYGSINKNRNVPKNNKNYKVTSHVDFSKLFLQPHMAQYSGIDETCDSSALLGIIINMSLFSQSVQTGAEKMRETIRNPWAHCLFSDWTTAKYADAFDVMKKLVKDLEPSNEENKSTLGKLNLWETEGTNFLSGTILGLEIVEETRQSVLAKMDESDNVFKIFQKDMKYIKNGFLEYVDRIKTLETKYIKIESNIKCMEAETKKKDEDHIPNHIRALHRLEIEKWKEDETTFLSTRATRHILELLPLHNCIVVTGSTGCGKSSIIHHAALQLRHRFEYEIIPVLSFQPCPSDIFKYYNKNKKQVFVVDDICGKETIDTHTLHLWREFSEDMGKKIRISEKNVEKNNDGTVSKVSSPKLLISCRLHIFKESEFQQDSLFTEKECNVLSPELCLLQEERMRMLRNYLSADTMEKLNEEQFKDNVDFFPLVCKMAKGTKPDDVQKLFEGPLNIIKMNLRNVIHANKYQFCALTLCILFDDGFNEEWLDFRAAPEEKKCKIKGIIDEFDIKFEKEFYRNYLKSGFSILDGTFLKQRGTEYRIVHDMIYKLAVVICGQECTECFIKYARSGFIRDRFIFESLTEAHGNDDLISISTHQKEEFFERLVRDLKDDDITSTFLNNQLEYQSFINELITFFSWNDNAQSVLNNLDLRGCILQEDHDNSYFYPQFKTTPLIASASRGYYDIVQFLICDVKCNVNNTDSRGRSPLHEASHRGHADVIKVLLVNKADINKGDPLGKSSLYLACEGGYTEAVKLLLQYNADVSKCDEDQRSPLHVACGGGHMNIVKLLLEENANIYQCDKYKMSPLYMACKGGFTDIVVFILEYRADVFQCDKNNCPLHVPCEEGHMDIFELLLKKHTDISQCSKSPLYFACKGGHIDIVNILLERKADVLQRDECSSSPLLISCKKGHTEVVKLLLQNKADVSECNTSGESPLYVSCERGYTEIVKLLLKSNAKVYEPRECHPYKDSPLYVACANGHTEIVQVLLQYNADVSLRNYGGISPLRVAIQEEHTETVKLLLQNKADPSERDNNGNSLLIMACLKKCLYIVKLLLKSCADVNRCNNDGLSPLFMACQTENIDIVKLLLQNFADPARCDKEGTSPLFVACQYECKDIVSLLLQYNADSLHCNTEGKSPLYEACQYKDKEIIQLLLQHGADPNRKDNEGYSPLYVAFQEDNNDIIELLLQNGANVSQCYNDGLTLLYVACEWECTDLVKLLLKHKADISLCNNNRESPLFVACQKHNIDVVDLLLQSNADVSLCNNDGESPLHAACKCGSICFVKLLLQKKANPSLRDNIGQSPLFVACQNHDIDIVKLLLKNNARVSLCNNDGESPLHAACKESHVEIVKLLLAWNADVCMCDNNGQTPLDIARESQCGVIVSLLETNLQEKASQVR